MKSNEQLEKRVQELEQRLEEFEQLIEAIKSGEVDAFALRGEKESEIYTLQSADYAYRVLIEEFSEGALNVTEEGLIVYTNPCFLNMIGMQYEEVIGASVFDFIDSEAMSSFKRLFLAATVSGKSKGEIILAGRLLPVYISMTSLQPKLATIGIIVTDLSEKKLSAAKLAEKHVALLRATKELRDTKTFVDNIIENTNQGVLVYASLVDNGRIVDFEVRYANKVALKELQLPYERVIGMRQSALVSLILPEEKKGDVFESMKRVAESRKSELHRLQSLVENKWYLVRLAPHEDCLITTFTEIEEEADAPQAEPLLQS